ncbi:MULTISPECIES: NAD-dependent epimerase [Pseudomonas]|uniref:NAD-dependent epimerase n=1 Tax=Pseudomonas TaxID=286 RepID=UPI0008763ADF|nr:MULTISPECIES: NAD-dependent epimerase [Pseudomonas]POA30227.1 NAD-dependent epimerase [Pseudomonas sp. GW456-12-1-14-TSB6]TFA81615.1 UDP-glucuronate 4-epimerase [Pseudomonas sp. LAIL14HWK12:I2]SCZ27327.1 UDP-glucuronate 4-epimerase [Pseudomonas sp. NFIX46]SDB07684.1 UDP-glucuronate 4-epimerase [Pseudomonas putida]SFQ83358.1 UDP-glucuronate 4-epimerase [Pseudomonas sp. NFIX49]
MKILVTGAAGFIGAHCVLRLVRDGHQVIGLDNFNGYYDPQLKHDRVDWVRKQIGDFQLATIDLADASALQALFSSERPQVVVHLAAQAGVRYSLENPRAYLHSNLDGFLNILECCRQYPVEHLIYASSSSVYGANQRTPYSVQDGVNHPLSLYAATKKANELMAHSYSHLFGIACTGLRFFTVYGPWGRPDMSPIQFAKAISEGSPLKLFNYGEHQRDFTYIDDIIESIARLIERAPRANPEWNREQPDPASSMAPWRLFNIGGQHPVALKTYLALLEKHLGQKAVVDLLPLQPGDVLNTCAEASDLAQATGFQPRIELDEGLGRFVAWFRDYYPTAYRPRAVRG